MTDGAETKLQLGGMALQNGLAVFGPTSWAAAIRLADGTLKIAEGRRPKAPGAIGKVPLLRGAVRLGEMLVVLPIIRRRLPEARLGFEQGNVAAMAGLCSAATKFERMTAELVTTKPLISASRKACNSACVEVTGSMPTSSKRAAASGSFVISVTLA